MNRIKKIMIIMLSLIMIMQMNVLGTTNTTVEINKMTPSITLTDMDERIFDVGYGFSVSYEQVLTGLDIVLVLDRSNSMLRPDPSTGLPVVDAVWNVVIDFVEEVYNSYPDSNIAIVSFGTNANKEDGWYYYDNLGAATTEINRIYNYRDLRYNYESSFSQYYYNDYRYAWENWDLYEGATNISAAFDYSAITVNNKQVSGQSSGQDVMILFTDGVATQGGSYSQQNYNYPTTHNTNTIAAYESGIAAQASAEVITVGYFEGISYESTKAVAREALELSQNAGFFEAAQTNQLTNIFDTIIDELNYIGTDATLVETIETEFEVVEESIYPDSYALSTDASGRQVITWQLGNITDKAYNYTYKVKVKEDVYPTGSGLVEIPVNQEATLYYTDLDGQVVVEAIGRNVTTIPARDNQPKVNVDISYENNQYGYLVGDNIKITHGLTFINIEPFDYREIKVQELRRMIEDENVNQYLALSENSIDSGWGTGETRLVYEINEENTVGAEENLTWNKDLVIEATASKEGLYQLSYGVLYQLTNSVGNVFDFYNQGNDLEAVDVKQGILSLDMVDTEGSSITEIDIYIDDSLVVKELDEENKVISKGIVSGEHLVQIPLPSGYRLITENADISIDVNDLITFIDEWSYGIPEISKTITFERLNIKDIKVQTLDDESLADIDQVVSQVDGKVTFTLTRPLDKVVLSLVDDFAVEDFEFTLNQIVGSGNVRNSMGTIIPGFIMIGNKLSYTGVTLPVGTYVAYGVMTPPSNLGYNIDYDYEVSVDEIVTREDGDVVEHVSPMTSSNLIIGVIDEEGPVITAIYDAEESSLNLINQDITLNDKINIVTYEIYEGNLTYPEIAIEENQLLFTVVENTGTQVLLEVDMPVDIIEENGIYITKGYITIYGEDAFGNKSLLVVEYEDDAINDLLDEDLI